MKRVVDKNATSKKKVNERHRTKSETPSVCIICEGYFVILPLNKQQVKY